jgi:hypothetical protein
MPQSDHDPGGPGLALEALQILDSLGQLAFLRVQITERQRHPGALRSHGLGLIERRERGIALVLAPQEARQPDQRFTVRRPLGDRVPVGLLGFDRASEHRERVAIDLLKLRRWRSQ